MSADVTNPSDFDAWLATAEAQTAEPWQLNSLLIMRRMLATTGRAPKDGFYSRMLDALRTCRRTDAVESAGVRS